MNAFAFLALTAAATVIHRPVHPMPVKHAVQHPPAIVAPVVHPPIHVEPGTIGGPARRNPGVINGTNKRKHERP